MDSNIKILILDDHEDITEIVEELILAQNDVVTVLLNDPCIAVDLVYKEKFTLIITDHHMPNISGLQLIEKIRSTEGLNKNTKIIFLTAMESGDTPEMSNNFSDITILNKVSDIESIGEIVKKLIL